MTNPRNKSVQVLFLTTILLALWNLTSAIVYSAPDVETARYWYRISVFFLLLFYPTAAVFALHFHGGHHPAVVSIVPYLFIVPVLYFNLQGQVYYKDFIRAGDYWVFIPEVANGVSVYTVSVLLLLLTFAAALFLHRLRTSPRHKVRYQARILFWSLVIPAGAIVTHEILVPVLFDIAPIPIAPLLFSIWTGGIWFAIVRFRFLGIQPGDLAQAILQNIDEAIVATDQNGTIITANPHVYRILDGSKDLRGTPFSAVIPLDLAASGRVVTTLLSATNRRIDIEIVSIPIIDRFDDPVGTIHLIHQIKGVAELVNEFHLTTREIDLLMLLMSHDTSNEEIADDMGVSIRTVKSHCTSIFEKLGVRTKLELLQFRKNNDYLTSAKPDGS